MKKTNAQGGTRSRPQARKAGDNRAGSPDKSRTSLLRRAGSARAVTDRDRNAGKRSSAAATATSRHVSPPDGTVTLRQAAKSVGMTVRTLVREIVFGDLIGKAGEPGIYVSEELLRTYLRMKKRGGRS